jgi:hypothetical protein
MAYPLRTERVDATAGILGIGGKKAEHWRRADRAGEC